MEKSRSLIVLCSAFFTFMGTSLVADATDSNEAAAQVDIPSLRANTKRYLNQLVAINGTLIAMTQVSQHEPQYVIEDQNGNRFPVAAWLPIETPPPRPGAEQHWKQHRPELMSDYAGKHVQIRGLVKSANMVESRIYGGEYYLRVQSAIKAQ